ncbi:BQ2448_1170 [Microbotryum intermedium]|uniref:BQ2448_1170 protein n=1 Tax=Microbotryum intermedium TaxID=269621 RepID=A0A238FFB1_9BASI|nr:BQ2448_1170 [Microbotryum intermedium]
MMDSKTDAELDHLLEHDHDDHTHDQFAWARNRADGARALSHASSAGAAATSHPPQSSLGLTRLRKQFGHGVSPQFIRTVALGTLLVLAAIGLLTLVGFAHGSLNYVDYSWRDIHQAGWSRIPARIDLGGDTSIQTLSAANSDANSDLDSSSWAGSDDAPIRQQQLHSDTLWNIHDLSKSSQTTAPPTSSSLSEGATAASDLHLLILTPLSTSSSDLDHYFALLDKMAHPRCNTSLGFLVADEQDDTASRLQQMLLDRPGFREITLIRKDFGIKGPTRGARHRRWWQQQRRAIMAKARTVLLMSALNASVDWVLWLDSDVAEYSPSLFEDLLLYGGTGVVIPHASYYRDLPPPTKIPADIVVPNVFMGKHPELTPYDLNSWAETSRSRQLKASLDPSKFIFEGGGTNLKRAHLADAFVRPSKLLSTFTASVYPHARPAGWQESDLYESQSPAFVGKRMDLDGVGGVATLVRADAHRMGAVFPAFLVDHQLETEGFGVLAKALGARIIGLPNYIVVHCELHHNTYHPRHSMRLTFLCSEQQFIDPRQHFNYLAL